MKAWVLIPLVAFIAVAGYQFGYYRAKLESRDADKVRAVSTTNAKSQSRSRTGGVDASPASDAVASETAPVASAALLARTSDNGEAQKPQAEPVQASVDALMASSTSQRQMQREQSDWADSFDYDEQNYAAATQLADFFTLHPEGDNVYLHSIQCDTGQCQLIGQFEGPHQRFEAIINELKQQPWWEYSGTSSNTTSDGGQTHFLLHLTSQ